MIPPRLALLAWFPISFYFFWRYPVRKAILINFLGGWALLPTASYPAAGVDFPYWILSSSLSTDYFLTKATVTGASCLLGVWFVDRKFYQRFVLSFWDLPMVAWCTVPLFSGIANSGMLNQGLRGEVYQLLAWGVPYFIGRVYFADTDSLRMAARAFVIAGLAYVPVCLVEVFTGPQLYTRLYGYQPYRWTEAHRYFGFRPIGLLENGNQLGIWMATSALIAAWLWRCRSVDRVLKLPIACVAALLFAVTILCQSGASIVLLFGLLPFIFVSQRYLPRAVTVLLVVGILTFGGLRLTNVLSLQTLVAKNPDVHAAAQFLQKIKRGSLTWRLEQDEGHVNTALKNPVLGSGEWDWWRDVPMRPWGLWMLVFGMYGFFGLIALEALQLLPVARVVWFPLARSDIEAFNLRYALGAAILMSAIDNLLNGAMILPLLLVVGGMSTWTSAASEVAIDVQWKTGPASRYLSN